MDSPPKQKYNTLMNPIRQSQVLFCLALLLVLSLLFLFEMELLPTDYVSSRQAIYYQNVAVVAVTLGGTYFCLRLMSHARVRAYLDKGGAGDRKRRYRNVANLRTFTLLLMSLVDLQANYGSSYGSSARYCLLICAIAALFCMPGSRELLSADSK